MYKNLAATFVAACFFLDFVSRCHGHTHACGSALETGLSA
jgi:hypothetical protein